MASFSPESYVASDSSMQLRSRFRFRSAVLVAGILGAGSGVVSCGGSASSAADDVPVATSVDLGDFEINLDTIDRFSTCPPVGGLGDPWIPAIHEEGSTNEAAWREPGVTDRAINDTLVPFRRCYRKGLVHDPTQAGHVAMVARVGADGKVAKVETYAACELSREVLACMADATHELTFDPPRAGHDTVVIPASYEPRGGRMLNPSTDRSAYASQAVRWLESARPGFHGCEHSEMSAGRLLDGSGTYRLDVDGRGRVAKVNIDPWRGNQQLLGCAAHVLQSTSFPKPPSGRAVIYVRLMFDPRQELR